MSTPGESTRDAPPLGGLRSVLRTPWGPWGLWLIATLAGGMYLSGQLFARGGDREIFLPGKTTDGHYQMELECAACHTDAFATREQLQGACEGCHADELEAVNDSHPRSKFVDPRNADRVAELDARYCVTCHLEHRPDATTTMGLTLPDDYCFRCHSDIAEERPSHEDLPFDSCAQAGCHNFHDNRALYEDFLAGGLDQPYLLPETTVLALTSGEPVHAEGRVSLSLAQHDAPAAYTLERGELAAGARGEHGRSGVNCSSCHGEGVEFRPQVDEGACRNCHEVQVDAWWLGKHGMRKARGLGAMTPARARVPMVEDSEHERLGCGSCHGAHDFDTRRAAVEACLGCHDDRHSQNYAASPHARLWEEERLGRLEPGQGVSCATCHLPRVRLDSGAVVAQHNQNENLRPNEKMVRSVCHQCHGLGFSLDALASAELIELNFVRAPTRRVRSLDMVRVRQSP